MHNGDALISIENTVSSEAVHYSSSFGKGISIVQQMIDIHNDNHGGNIVFKPSVQPQHFKGGYRCEIQIAAKK
jgi:hypothetical protein